MTANANRDNGELQHRAAKEMHQPVASPKSQWLPLQPPALAPPSLSPAAATSIDLPDVEVSLVRPGGKVTTPALPESHKKEIRSSHGQESQLSHEYDYFSQSSDPHYSIQDPTFQSHPPSEQALEAARIQNTKAFVEKARNELYGPSSTQIEATKAWPYEQQQWEEMPAGVAHISELSRHPGPPQRAMTDVPQYPNQSLSALHTQKYPDFYKAPYNARQRFTARQRAAAVQDEVSRTRSRTAGNTPAQTPSLFVVPRPLPNVDSLTDESPYPSPYLHPSQPHPKTTNTADRQTDIFSGHKLINHYEVLEELGRGVHGKVKLARDLDTGEYVAIKYIRRYPKKRRLGKSSNPEEKVKREIAILKKAQHPNVVRMIEVIDDPEDKQVYIVLEFLENKDIAWRVRGNTEIILMENRRFELESQGIPSEVVAQSDSLIKAALRRKEKSEVLQRRLAKRSKSESNFWSLEYAGETDEESDLTSEPISQTTSLEQSSASLKAGESASAPARDSLGITAEKERKLKTSTTSSQEVEAQESRFGTYSLWGEIDHSASGHGLHTSASNASLDPPPSDSSRGRQASLAESATSRITEMMEDRYPEEFRFVPTMTIPQCRAAFRDALVGLEYLHYHGIIHRDIKPENLLRTKDNRVKISDFGVSYLGKPIRDGGDSEDVSESESPDAEAQEETELAKTVGTPAFYAPELCQLDFDANSPSVTGKIDIWALGVTLFCMLFARLPFKEVDTTIWALMKEIREDDIFIPSSRLKAVDAKPNARPQSQGPYIRSNGNEKRAPSEWTHEAIDEELLDLFKRLLTKDPKKRISIKEIKHHPWVLAGLLDPSAWLAETDPVRLSQGKKIEISKQEVDEAFKPRVMDRFRSLASRASKALGLTSGTPAKSRKRTESSASLSESGPAAAYSPGDDPVKDPKKMSPKPEDGASNTNRAHRDVDHPLSRSVAVGLESVDSRRSRSFTRQDSQSPNAPSQRTVRPSMPDRNASEMSTATSIKTVTQSDFPRGRSPSGRLASSPEGEHEGSPVGLGFPGAATIGNLLGETGKNLLRSVRSRERRNGPQSPHMSIPELDDTPEEFHGRPSVAVSNTTAHGRFDAPTSHTSSPVISSANPSRATSPTSGKIVSTFPEVIGDTDSPEFTHPTLQGIAPLDFGNSAHEAEPLSARSDQATAEEWDTAQDALDRRRAIEDERDREHRSSRPSTSVGMVQAPCPPSPDDERSPEERMVHAKRPTPSAQSPHTIEEYFPPSSPPNTAEQVNAQPISSTSSEDQYTSGISQSTSFPSMPSVASAKSSLVPESVSTERLKDESASSSEDTSNTQSFNSPITAPQQNLSFSGPDSDDGYVGDGDTNADDTPYAVESDSSGGDSDDGDFLVMNRRNVQSPRQVPADRSSRTPLTTYRGRRGTAERRSSTKTPSTQTVETMSSSKDSVDEPNKGDVERP